MDRQPASSVRGALKRTLLVLVLLSGCAPEESAPAPKQAAKAAAETARLDVAQVAAIRTAIEQCGGTIRLDDDGQPIAVDLAAERASADKAGLQAALECPGLKSLRVRAAGLAEQDFDGITSLVSLEELFLQDVPIQGASLDAWLAELTSLRRVTLRNMPGVTSTASLASLPHLTHLALIDMPIEVGAIGPLVGAENLLVLDLRMCGRLGGEQLSILADIPDLKELKLGGYAIDNQSMAVVALMPSVESLTVEDASVDAQGLAELAVIGSRLRSLSLARCAGLGDEELRAIGAFDALRVLSLRDMPVTGEFLQAIARPDQLESLSLNQTFLLEESVDAIIRCKHLKRLELAQNFLTASVVEKIGALVELEYLNLTECGLDAASLEPLRKLGKLETLLVEGNVDIDEQTVKEILGQ